MALAATPGSPTVKALSPLANSQKVATHDSQASKVPTLTTLAVRVMLHKPVTSISEAPGPG
jgi:hypothetical protein